MSSFAFFLVGREDGGMGYEEHKELAKDGGKVVGCAVVTCSDTRREEDDVSGRMIVEMVEGAGHRVVWKGIRKDDPAAIRGVLAELCARGDVQAIVFNGGTGVSRRDNTFDAVSGALTKTLPGFGEIFRMLSYQTIGSGAILSRATAGVVAVSAERHVVVFSIPGSPNAVGLAMEKLILPEISHLVWETGR